MLSAPSPTVTRIKPLRFLSLLLGILVAFILGTLVFELSLLTLDTSDDEIRNVQRLLHAAAAPGAEDTATVADVHSFYPDGVYDIDWSRHISESDLLHEAALHRACLKYKNSVISYEVGRVEQDEAQNRLYLVNETDPQLLEKLKQCPDFDVYIPRTLRGFGYCEDAAAYTKSLKSRMLPRWVLNYTFQDTLRKQTVTYHELCPKTPMIFFNHYWNGLPDALDWPAAKPLYLMPNMDMYEIRSEHFWRADGGLVQDGAVCEVCHSDWKGTKQVLDCWLSRPDLPLLELYTTHSSLIVDYAERIVMSKNVLLHNEQLEPAAFGRLITDATYFMCSSTQEGYGHYINQARTSRALIFTTDVAPMNELITSRSGVLIKARAKSVKNQFLSGKSSAAHALRNVPGFFAEFNGTAVCDAVMDMLNNTTVKEREKRADKALQQYYFDVVFFMQKMQELRKFARAQSNTVK
ncbi:unnamed protein product [Peronospora destructor]|uniref:Uncharacterized protein n=1 Tax=Peronospora destructor TaxID=86335 RepID=A0AAV0T4D0_9STRA|nr:unnamed protein product [Peronospora destructor]